jgi:hypothetical protein
MHTAGAVTASPEPVAAATFPVIAIRRITPVPLHTTPTPLLTDILQATRPHTATSTRAKQFFQPNTSGGAHRLRRFIFAQKILVDFLPADSLLA